MIVPDGPNNRVTFQTHVDRVFATSLPSGNIVVMYNFGSHKKQANCASIEIASTSFMPLQHYSPHHNPIEVPISKLKAMLRKATERAVENPLVGHRTPLRHHYARSVRQLLRHHLPRRNRQLLAMSPKPKKSRAAQGCSKPENDDFVSLRHLHPTGLLQLLQRR
ncbi:hypothetical protein EKPJFOCH_2048 [Methylobacterium thuringiense]|uniref:Tc1-like transposase DDE domain-containing protein n=1 Tax=Methylobacterium thuringiense TaxID=1003091 RepID=A0ABQ4TL35_9HYPH|nr:hypothetical protein EKPJFOCH_2048 [Methylobacterium thuringiense]